MTQPKHFSYSTTSISSPSTTTISTAIRRVRFKFDDNDRNTHRYTRSFEDVRLPEKNYIHRVEFEIPLHKGI